MSCSKCVTVCKCDMAFDIYVVSFVITACLCVRQVLTIDLQKKTIFFDQALHGVIRNNSL